MIVADTNLVVNFLVRGEHSHLADAVYTRDASWHMPPLWRSEFANTLATLARAKQISAATATDALRHGLALFGAHEHASDMPRVLQIALASGCTAHDCEFVALAETLAAPLVTADKAILRAFPNVAVSPADFAR